MNAQPEPAKSVRIEAINRSRRFAVDEKGQLWPFVSYLDREYYDCDEENASHLMVGDVNLGFVIIELSNYAFKKLH